MTVPSQEWWTAEEIAAAGLPDLPETRRGVADLIAREGWKGAGARARKRPGRGGAWEFSWTLFPARARQALLARAAAEAAQAARADRGAAWAWFERQPETVRSEAAARLAAVQAAEALFPALGRSAAVEAVARERSVSARTLWRWLAAAEAVQADDRLPALAPRYRADARREATRAAEGAAEFIDLLRSDWLRPERPPFTDCYRRAVRIARERGWEVLPERSARRRLEAGVSRTARIALREGREALRQAYPAQERDRSALRALEAVNADFHRFDVFVRWPGQGRGAERVVRPQLVAFQDVYSGRILAWRVAETPNAEAVLLAAGDLIERWGIPEHVILDNGREFAAKAVTGGAPTRFRFRVQADEVPGLFTSLGVTVHWTTPYSGQSKPIERAFRDLASTISRDPRLAGAWTGNRPDAKPENYGRSAVPLERFLAVVAEGIEEHNTREGRRSAVAAGRSLAEVFDESYASAPIRRATEAQRRLWLLRAEGLVAERRTGAVRLFGNRYWAPWMAEFAGARVVVRFDPADLHGGVQIYSAEGAWLGAAPCVEPAGFLDVDGAREHARARAAWIAAERRAAEAQRRFSAAELGAALDAAPVVPAQPVEARVVRPVFGTKPRSAAEAAPAGPAPVAEHPAVTGELVPRRGRKPAAEEPRARFRRALDLERRLAAGAAVTPEEAQWFEIYRQTPEYRAERRLWEQFGNQMFG